LTQRLDIRKKPVEILAAVEATVGNNGADPLRVGDVSERIGVEENEIAPTHASPSIVLASVHPRSRQRTVERHDITEFPPIITW
jgi:hypothetical protein